MKVLLSAIACHPQWGSEAHVGWQAMLNIAQTHEVWVLTHCSARPGIEEAINQKKVPSHVRFHYLGNPGPCHPNRMIARLGSWWEFHQWNQAALELGRKLQRENHFDLVHHVTYATWRMPSPLWRLDAPFIWGPVGGVASFPWRFFPILSTQAKGLEAARNIANLINAKSHELEQCLKNSAAIIASNQESYDFFAKIRGNTQGLHLLSAASFSEEKIAALNNFTAEDKSGDVLRLFAGGNMIGSKGVGLALRVLAELKARGIKFHYTVGGRGPETGYLEKLSARLGLSGHVHFDDGIRGQAYLDTLKKSHVFFMPSFRENAPVTILEAMLAGCVPCVVDASAQGEIVRKCGLGFAAPIKSIQECEEALCDYLLSCKWDTENWSEKGRACSTFVSQQYGESKYRDYIQQLYRQFRKA